MLPSLSFALGGASSGKSAFAETLVLKGVSRAIYIATAEAFDDEMRAKISAHQARRGSEWVSVEAPHDLARAVVSADAGVPILIDCVTLWLTNRLMADADVQAESEALVEAVVAAAQPVVVVSNEVGNGIVPEHAMSRRFRDAQGRLNQMLAARADLVVQVVAGLPNVLKGTLPDG